MCSSDIACAEQNHGCVPDVLEQAGVRSKGDALQNSVGVEFFPHGCRQGANQGVIEGCL